MSLPMTKTARETLHNFALTYRVESKESRNQCLDKTLKELEAIMMVVIDAGKMTGSSRGSDNVGIILSAISVATRVQRQALSEALYGKGSNND